MFGAERNVLSKIDSRVAQHRPQCRWTRALLDAVHAVHEHAFGPAQNHHVPGLQVHRLLGLELFVAEAARVAEGAGTRRGTL